MDTLGAYAWDTTRGDPPAGGASFAFDPVPGYANALRISDTDDLGNDRSAVLATVVEGDTIYLARRNGNVVILLTAVVNDTPVNGTGFYGFPVTLPQYFSENDEPGDEEEVTAFSLETSGQGWPQVSELAQILNIEPEETVTAWLTTLNRILAAAITHVKAEVGRWDDGVNTPNDNLAGAALRMAELMSQRPGTSTAPATTDAAYQAFMTGQHKRFGLA